MLITKLSHTPDDQLAAEITANAGVFPALDEAKDRPAYLVRAIIAATMRDGLVIDGHYKMVDGTSFAAPIVTSVVAQMLEANPGLNPLQIKRILLQTAHRIPNVSVERQGWGAVQPRAAVERALHTPAGPRMGL